MEPREPGQDRAQRHLEFHPRQVGAQAVVGPVAEGDVRVRVAGEVEFPRAGKDALVAVGKDFEIIAGISGRPLESLNIS